MLKIFHRIHRQTIEGNLRPISLAIRHVKQDPGSKRCLSLGLVHGVLPSRSFALPVRPHAASAREVHATLVTYSTPQAMSTSASCAST